MRITFIKTNRSINGVSSLLLDTMRLAAALLVVFHHTHEKWFSIQLASSKQIHNLGHAAVIIFFVLSGYVIAFTTGSNNRGAKEYAKARLTRLSSVVIPALIFTALAEITVKLLNPILYESYIRGLSWPRYIISGLFLNEIWFFSAAPPMNAPLWSLSYEFWYYAIFGLWIYRGRSLKSIVLPLLACVIAGPKILLLMPVWLCGCLAYRLPRPKISTSKSWILVALSLVLAGLIVIYLAPFPYYLGTKPFFFANQFLTDWVIALFISLALWLLPSVQPAGSSINFIKKFRKIADFTFPIYVLHFPLLKLYPVFFTFRPADTVQMWQAITFVLFFSVLLGLLIEKYRFVWKRFFDRIFQSRRLQALKSGNLMNTYSQHLRKKQEKNVE